MTIHSTTINSFRNRSPVKTFDQKWVPRMVFPTKESEDRLRGIKKCVTKMSQTRECFAEIFCCCFGSCKPKKFLKWRIQDKPKILDQISGKFFVLYFWQTFDYDWPWYIISIYWYIMIYHNIPFLYFYHTYL